MRHSTSLGDRLDLEPFYSLCGEFSGLRIDQVKEVIAGGQPSSAILGFVRGLKLSSHLIYAVRGMLDGAGLQADWGHILDRKGIACSPECDVVIHRGWRTRWNGHDSPVMDFKFIESEKAVAVISCKSYLKSVTAEHREYCQRVRKYVDQVWLFAECCPPQAVSRLRKAARSAGYAEFWYLYPWDGERAFEPNQQGWLDFIKQVRKLASSRQRKGPAR